MNTEEKLSRVQKAEEELLAAKAEAGLATVPDGFTDDEIAEGVVKGVKMLETAYEKIDRRGVAKIFGAVFDVVGEAVKGLRERSPAEGGTLPLSPKTTDPVEGDRHVGDK